MPMGAAMGASGGDKTAVTKKLTPPVVTNGQPVHGRFIADRLDSAPVVTRVRAKRPATKLETDSKEQAKKP